MSTKASGTVDGYIETFPENVQKCLEKIRKTIRQVMPEAKEVISYQIPAFKLNGKYPIYFGGWKNNVSLYPVPAGDNAFKKAIAPYVAGKGTIKFPLGKPVPHDLIREIAQASIKNI